MKQVSAAYKTAMREPMRSPTLVKISFGFYDTTAAVDSTLSDNGHEDYSNTSALEYEHNVPPTYATLELNRWRLNGKQDIMPDSNPVNEDFISDKLSDENGAFSEGRESVFTITFTEAHTIPGLTLNFDTRTKEWPGKIDIDYYLSNAIVKTAHVDVTHNFFVVNEPVASCDKIQITFREMLPYRRPRLELILYGIGVTFEGDDVETVKQSHDVDPLSRRLPKESFSFSLFDFGHRYDPDNPSGSWQYIDGKSPIKIQYGQTLADGSVEWIDGDSYTLNGRPKAKNGRAAFTGTGVLGGMTDKYYKSQLGSKNLYDMAVAVLQDANLVPDAQGNGRWLIDESLRSMTTTGVLPIATHAQCLQIIAHAAGCKLYTDSDNYIHLEPFSIDSAPVNDFNLDFSTISEKSQSVTKIPPLKAIEVSKYTIRADGASKELYKETTAKTHIHAVFSELAQNVNISLSAGSVVSSQIYGRCADIDVTAGNKTVTITGIPLKEAETVLTYPVSQDGEVDSEKNPLITSDAMADTLEEHIKNYLLLRTTYDADYRGNPEVETGDIISMQTPFTETQQGLVLTNGITYNGALRGKVKVKRLL